MPYAHVSNRFFVYANISSSPFNGKTIPRDPDRRRERSYLRINIESIKVIWCYVALTNSTEY